MVDGAHRDHQPIRDLGVGQAGGHEVHDLELPGGETGGVVPGLWQRSTRQPLEPSLAEHPADAVRGGRHVELIELGQCAPACLIAGHRTAPAPARRASRYAPSLRRPRASQPRRPAAQRSSRSASPAADHPSCTRRAPSERETVAQQLAQEPAVPAAPRHVHRVRHLGPHLGEAAGRPSPFRQGDAGRSDAVHVAGPVRDVPGRPHGRCSRRIAAAGQDAPEQAHRDVLTPARAHPAAAELPAAFVRLAELPTPQRQLAPQHPQLGGPTRTSCSSA